MSLPSVQQVHANRPLTNILVAFMQSEANFVADRVFPGVAVTNKSNTYYTFPREYWLVSRAQKRAAGAVAAKTGYTVSTDSYNCERDAIAHPIPDPVRENADAPLSLDANASRFVASQLMMSMEVAWAAAYFTTGIWTGSTTGSDIVPATTWDDGASTPIEDIRTQIRAVHTNTGYSPNTLVLGFKCFHNLIDHPDVLDRIKHAAGPGNPAIANEQTLAALLGLERILVAKATRNTAQEGVAASYSLVNGTRNAALVYANPAPAIDAPSAGYTFYWGGLGQAASIKTYRDEAHESDIVEGGVWYAQKVVSAALGVFFSNAVAA